MIAFDWVTKISHKEYFGYTQTAIIGHLVARRFENIRKSEWHAPLKINSFWRSPTIIIVKRVSGNNACSTRWWNHNFERITPPQILNIDVDPALNEAETYKLLSVRGSHFLSSLSNQQCHLNPRIIMATEILARRPSSYRRCFRVGSSLPEGFPGFHCHMPLTCEV